jgi:hypothetical protein
MGSFAVDFLLHAADSGVLDCTVTTINCRMSALSDSFHSTPPARSCADRVVRTVEKRIVGRPNSSTDEHQSSKSTKETFWRASASTHPRSPSSEFALEPCPRFLGIRSSHYGGMLWGVDAVFVRREGGDSRRWRRARVGDALKLIVNESRVRQ